MVLASTQMKIFVLVSAFKTDLMIFLNKFTFLPFTSLKDPCHVDIQSVSSSQEDVCARVLVHSERAEVKNSTKKRLSSERRERFLSE